MKRDSTSCAVCLVTALLAGRCAAAVLTEVPMGPPGAGMVHAVVQYDSLQNRLNAHVETPIPLLTPLDVSYPADSFSPDDPWFWCLDPSQLDMAFSRQYGFVMEGDTPPSDMGVWIRLVNHTPGLEFYRYRSSVSVKLWQPMFGTAGSTNVFIWDLRMFHPAIAAMPTNGTHTALFEAFAVDLASGQPLAGIPPAPFTLVWTIVPSAKPVLRLGHDLVLSWPATATNYVLQAAASLSPDAWMMVTNSPVISAGEYKLSVAPLAPQRFFRLIRVP